MKVEESKSFGSSILYGVITIFLLAVVGSIIFSLILRFTAAEEASLQFMITAVSFISIFAGGFISGSKGKQKGWFLGGLTGMIYSLIIFLYQYLGYDSLFQIEQIIYHVCYILTAMMGGILGVNMTSSKEQKS